MQGMKSLEWDDLRVFLAICRKGTLSAAARELRVNQTTVSRRLSALEKSLEAKLFVRTPTGFVPTEVGRTIVASAEAMESQVLQLQRQASGEDARLSGTVKVTTTEPLLINHFLPSFAGFTARYPELQVEVVTGYESLSLLRREADLAIRMIRPTEAELVASRIGELAIALFASRAYLKRRKLQPTSPLNAFDLVGYGGNASEWPEARWLRANAPHARIPLKLNSILGLRAAALAGVGAAMMPCFLGSEAGLVRIGAPIPELTRTIWLVFHRDLQRTARVRALADYVTEQISAVAHDLTARPEKRKTRPS